MATSLYIDGRYDALHPTWHAEDSAWKAQHVLEMMLHNGLQPAKVCEIGCGAGGILRSLQGELAPSCEFVGYEISPQAYARCVQHANKRLRFVLGNYFAHTPQDTDVMLCMDVVEHVDDYLGFLKRIRGSARHKMFHVPMDLSAQGIIRGVPEAVRKSAGHLHYFTRKLFLDALEETGYTVEDWAYTPAATALPSRSIAMACAKWPRKMMFAMAPEITSRVLGGFSLLVLAK
jgi:cyclopropane fatty-acyl-phospholipid synthase-like methyltransferase